jgi:glutathione S-transferase
MTPTLAIGDRAYSSWSLRGWLVFDAFGLPVQIRRARLYSDELPALLAEFAPARTVPALRLADGTVVWDSLAIAETLHEANPGAGLWPADPALRALARSLAAEMHAGFTALRGDCPQNLRVAYADFAPSDAVRADLARIEALWTHALDRSGGPWLCGDYSAADVFFAPVAGRIATYGLPVGDRAMAYVRAHLAHAPFRRWRAMGLVDGADQPFYARPHLTRSAWPGPAPLPAEVVATGPSVNATCPYSGQPVTDFARIEGQVWGFCNPFCRDKTVADPAAWPAFADMRKRAGVQPPPAP